MLHAKLVALQHEVDRLVSLGQRHRHHYALASGQAISLDDDGRAHAVNVRMRQGRVGEGVVSGGRNTVTGHKRLGKRLGAFQLRSGLCGAEHGHTVGTQLVNQTCGQRGLGPHHHQANAVGPCPGAHSHHVGGRQLRQTDQPLVARCAAVARCHVHLCHGRALVQLPGQGVFAATVAHY